MFEVTTIVLLLIITFKLFKMSAETQALKDRLAAIDSNLDNINADIALLNEKLNSLSGGATAAEIAELQGIVDGLADKSANIAAETPEEGA